LSRSHNSWPLWLLTRSCKSTRRHAIEIMNNLMYLRDACFEAMSIYMHMGIRKLISPWLHCPIQTLLCQKTVFVFYIQFKFPINCLILSFLHWKKNRCPTKPLGFRGSLIYTVRYRMNARNQEKVSYNNRFRVIIFSDSKGRKGFVKNPSRVS
jgi:hypothetical protein